MNTMIQENNKTDRKTRIIWSIKALFLMLALIVAYLFALNGRYAPIDEDYDLYFDKWTKTILEIERYDTVK